MSFCDFVEDLVILPDGSRPVFRPHQRTFWTLATKIDADRRFQFRTVLDSEVKKSGKTSINA